MSSSHSTHAKRKSTPPSALPIPKRQRLDSPLAQTTSIADSPDAANSSSRDSLSSLSPVNSPPSSPEADDEPANGGVAGKSNAKVPAPVVATLDAGTDEEGAGDGEGYEGEGEGDEAVLLHPDISAKTLPSAQPRPLDPSPAVPMEARPTQGGKGKKGEEALEHAVAAREKVERRREELWEEQRKAGGLAKPKAVPAAGAREVHAKVPGEVDVEVAALGKVKDEEVDMVVQAATEDDDLAAPVRRERPAIAEERADIIRFVVVTNDGSPSSLIILTGLKNIFQKQLPKMPREYIARLVYDRNHYSMAIVKRGLEVVGGITYRPFDSRQFAEIVFCAITGTEQVKGYGSHLMNHLKDHVKAATKCMHFLTYADNYAIGYFKKQGFTKDVGLDRSVWAGYIKDYEGGTIMHCSMLERVTYLESSAMLAKQKEIILGEIRQLSQSHVVHPGLTLFANLAPGTSLDPSQVPGLTQSGWTPEMDELTRRPKRGPQFAVMQRLLTLLVDHPSAWAFANPVNAGEVTDYYDVIKEPMDFATMDRKLESNSYTALSEFTYDASLIFNNCRQYNDPGSNYVKNANKLEAYLAEQVKVYEE